MEQQQVHDHHQERADERQREHNQKRHQERREERTQERALERRENRRRENQQNDRLTKQARKVTDERIEQYASATSPSTKQSTKHSTGKCKCDGCKSFVVPPHAEYHAQIWSDSARLNLTGTWRNPAGSTIDLCAHKRNSLITGIYVSADGDDASPSFAAKVPQGIDGQWFLITSDQCDLERDRQGECTLSFGSTWLVPNRGNVEIEGLAQEATSWVGQMLNRSKDGSEAGPWTLCLQWTRFGKSCSACLDPSKHVSTGYVEFERVAQKSVV